MVLESFTDIPLRQLTRLRAELGISAAQFTAGLFPEDPLLGIEVGVVARVCLQDWVRGKAVVLPVEPERAITIRKIALSLRRAPETVRRRANLLIDRGVFASSPNGLSLATTAENEALMRCYYLGVHDRFLRLIEDASTTCELNLAVGPPPSFGLADVLERALDTLLLPIDTFRPTGLGKQAHLLWAALTAVAIRRVTYDPVLSRRYANEIPPDALRADTSLRRLAAAMSIPYATAWRQVQALEAAGLVARLSGERWTVRAQNLLVDGLQDLSSTPSTILFRKLRELAQLGLAPARAADHYQLGRPPLADFGQPSEL